MPKTIEEIIDRLIINGARVTEQGRLDFPDRLPFCFNFHCRNYGCIFGRLGLYIVYSKRLGGDAIDIAIGKCKPIKLKDVDFPYIYYSLDSYSEVYYLNKILPVILKFYDEDFLAELFKLIKKS